MERNRRLWKLGFWWHWVCTCEKKQQVFSVSWCGNRLSGSALTILSSRVVLMIDQRSSRCCISITTSFSLKTKIVLNAMNEAVELDRTKPFNKSERLGRDRFFLFSGCLDQKKFKLSKKLIHWKKLHHRSEQRLPRVSLLSSKVVLKNQVRGITLF